MKPGWRVGLPICTVGCIAVRIGRFHREGVYIEKDDGRNRPLGIAALEDKIVQYAVVTILNHIYEEDFLGFSYGFRPRRSQHQALDALSRYADDIVLGFQWGTDADRFRKSFGERLGKFGLELHPDKTRRIEFGRFAEQNRKRRGEGKPDTFDFLGFQHISGKNGLGRFMVRRTTIRKRMRAKLRQIGQQLRKRMHDPVPHTGEWLKSVVQGYFNYYAVPGNLTSLGVFRDRVLALWWRTLRRRSQKRRVHWTRILSLGQRWLPQPRALHPFPDARFAATHPR